MGPHMVHSYLSTAVHDLNDFLPSTLVVQADQYVRCVSIRVSICNRFSNDQ